MAQLMTPFCFRHDYGILWGINSCLDCWGIVGRVDGATGSVGGSKRQVSR